MTGHDIIVVGASAGGVEALVELIRGLPAGLRAALFVVLHVPADSPSVLPAILSRAGLLPAAHALDGEEIQRGRIYVAPPDRHLLILDGHVHVARGPKENGHRPAVDPLFRSAARFYGRRVVGVVLSGALDDGTAGLLSIKERGGITIVQDPDEALFSSMPRSALVHGAAQHTLPVAEIGALLVSLAGNPGVSKGDEAVSTRGADDRSEDLELEVDIAGLDPEALQQAERPGTPSGFTCPECHGGLWELREGELFRYRCRVGHAFTAASLLDQHTEYLERALWVALKALEEKGAMVARLAERSSRAGRTLAAERFREQEQEARAGAEIIRRELLTSRTLDPLLAISADEDVPLSTGAGDDSPASPKGG